MGETLKVGGASKPGIAESAESQAEREKRPNLRGARVAPRDFGWVGERDEKKGARGSERERERGPEIGRSVGGFAF